MTELRLALRALLRTPGFTAVAVLTLALAVGVNSGIFALVYAAAFRPLVPPQAGELVNLFNGSADPKRGFRAFSHDEFQALRKAGAPLDDVAAWALTQAGIESPAGLRRGNALFTSENYLDVLGVKPAQGRFFSAAECRPGAETPVVVASHALWQASGGGADFVGSTLRLNGRPYTVIGIMPERFNGLSAFVAFDLWVPLGLMGSFNLADSSQLAHPGSTPLLLTARLAPGVTLAAATPRLAGLAAILTQSAANPGHEPRVLVAEAPSRENISNAPGGGNTRGVGLTVFAMAGGVLLVACLNLANLFLARGARRAREIAVRAALGGSRWQIVRQLLTEGALVALAGGALGLALATGGSQALLNALASVASLYGETLAVDGRPGPAVLGVTLGLCTVATLVFSLVPALRTSRVDLVTALKQAPASGSRDRFARFFSGRHCLVMGQIAVSLALLFCAALFVRGALAAGQVDPGFRPRETLQATFDYSLTALTPADARRAAFALEERLAALPGVQAAALATFTPYSSRRDGRSVRAAEAPADSPSQAVSYAGVTGGYFDALSLRLLRGRTFTPAEDRADGAARVAIIDDQLAQKLFRTGDAVGRSLRIGSTTLEIVGICPAHRHSNRRAAPEPRVFVPYASASDGRPFALIRYADGLDAADQAAGFRRALQAADANAPLLRLAPMELMIEKDFTRWMSRLGAAIFGFFGLLALLLAVIGVYAVKSQAVLARTQEIGIRMALGAQRGQILGLLLRQSALQLALAAALGTGTALAAGQVVAAILYQVSAADPAALALSLAVLGLTAFAASLLPALRATRLHPLTALRAD